MVMKIDGVFLSFFYLIKGSGKCADIFAYAVRYLNDNNKDNKVK
jgi:hypothetical protein